MLAQLKDLAAAREAVVAADLGLVAGTVETGSLETHPFRRDRFVLVVARDHALELVDAIRHRG